MLSLLQRIDRHLATQPLVRGEGLRLGAKIIWCRKDSDGKFKRVGNRTINKISVDKINNEYFPFFKEGEICSVTLDKLDNDNAVFYRSSQPLSNCRVMSRSAVLDMKKFSDQMSTGTVVSDPETRHGLWISGDGGGRGHFNQSNIIPVKSLPSDVDETEYEDDTSVSESQPPGVDLVVEGFEAASRRINDWIDASGNQRIRDSLSIDAVDHVIRRSINGNFAYLLYSSETKFKFDVRYIDGGYSIQRTDRPIQINDVVLFDDRTLTQGSKDVNDVFVILYDKPKEQTFIFPSVGHGGRSIAPSPHDEEYIDVFKNVLEKYLDQTCTELRYTPNGKEYVFSNAGFPHYRLQIYSLEDRFHQERGTVKWVVKNVTPRPE